MVSTGSKEASTSGKAEGSPGSGVSPEGSEDASGCMEFSGSGAWVGSVSDAALVSSSGAGVGSGSGAALVSSSGVSVGPTIGVRLVSGSGAGVSLKTASSAGGAPTKAACGSGVSSGRMEGSGCP